MNSRRHFLTKATAAAGLVFCGCGMAGSVYAQDAPARLPIMVNDKRVKTIDVHSHCLFHETLNMMGEEKAKALVPPINNSAEAFVAVEQRLKAMDS